MVKSQDTAREQNKREQRRLQVHFSQKNGPEFAAKYRLKELNREQRIISKELDRIRKGIHKPLANEYAASSQGEKRDMFIRFSEIKSTAIYSQAETDLYRTMVFMKNNPSALVPIVDAHSHSQAYIDTIQRCTPGFTPSPREQFVPNYLKRFNGIEISEGKNPYTTKYSALLYRQSPLLSKNIPTTNERNLRSNGNGPVVNVVKQIELTHVPSPLLGLELNANKNGTPSNLRSRNVNINGEKQSVKREPIEPDNNEQVVTDHFDNEQDVVDAVNEKESTVNEKESNETLKAISVPQHQTHLTEDDDENNLELQLTESTSLPATNRSSVVSANRFDKELISTSTPTSNRPRQPLDILTLSDNGIQSARENISKRLTNTGMTSTVNTSGVADRKASIATGYKGVDDSKANAAEDDKNKPLTATKAMFPSYDQETYNADGSLRTCHQLPDFDDSYQQARKARYCRSKEHLERERELKISEIFDKK